MVEGRTIFQRLLTYTLKSVAHKFVGALFLFIGLIMTGQAVLTPLLLVISMITGDFLSMLSSTDRVRPSVAPSMWRVNSLTFAGIALGFCVLIFCISTVAFAKYHLGFDIGHIQTLSVMTLIFSGQALLYCVRERRHFWSSRPSRWLMVSSILDIMIISSLAATGTFMKALPVSNIAILLGATLIFGIFLDLIKFQIFRILKIC